MNLPRFIRLFVIYVFVLFSLCACKYDRGLILFNSQPINSQNALNDNKVFTQDTRVYYLFIAPKKMQSDKFIRVQIFKMTDKAPWGGNEVVRTKDYRLMEDERYYHSDYFVLHESGRYVMQVFSHDDFVNPLAINYFYIK